MDFCCFWKKYHTWSASCLSFQSSLYSFLSLFLTLGPYWSLSISLRSQLIDYCVFCSFFHDYSLSMLFHWLYLPSTLSVNLCPLFHCSASNTWHSVPNVRSIKKYLLNDSMKDHPKNHLSQEDFLLLIFRSPSLEFQCIFCLTSSITKLLDKIASIHNHVWFSLLGFEIITCTSDSSLSLPQCLP